MKKFCKETKKGKKARKIWIKMKLLISPPTFWHVNQACSNLVRMMSRTSWLHTATMRRLKRLMSTTSTFLKFT